MKSKKIYRAILCVLVLSLFINMNSFVGYSESKWAEVPNVTVDINGVIVNNNTLKYPLVLIDGHFYYPLTWELVKMIGYTSHYTPESGLRLTKANTDIKANITALSIGKSKITKSVLPVHYNVAIDDVSIVVKRPLYNLSGVTYLPINDTSVIGLTASYSIDQGLSIRPSKSITTLPKQFNTYDQLDINKLIRSQGTASTCWAFAANTLFEVAIAKTTNEYNDFSEDHLINNTPIPANYESGGNFLMSSIYFQNKLGPVYENLAPIGSQSKGKRYEVPYTLLNYEEINNDLVATKRAIFENGATLSSLYLNELDKKVYNSKTYAYYNPDIKLKKTHELVLIGWDDAYNKDNFTIKPKRNGAFIAQNSFGNSWGDKGFFYISYEDVHILEQVYSITAFEPIKSNARQYLYDQTGITHFESYGAENNGIAVNNYTSISDEILKRISIYTPENNMEISLYYGNGLFKKMLGSPRYIVKIANKGYHTIDLPITLSLAEKDSFWIAAEYVGKTPFLMPIEAPYPGIGYSMTGNRGEGFIGDGNTFSDILDIRNHASIGLRATTFK